MHALSPILFVAVGVLAAWILYTWARDCDRTARRAAALREQWGKPKVPARGLDAVARYHAHANLTDAGRAVDDGTWRDLGMDFIYAHVDRTASFAGGARLYHRLRTPEGPLPALRRFDELATAFGRDPAAREDVQSVFASIDDYGQPQITEVLFGTLPSRLAMRNLFPVLTFFTILALVASIASPVARVLLGVLAIASIAVRMLHGRRGLVPGEGLRKVSGLFAVGRGLARLRRPALEPELGKIRGTMDRLAGLARATSWLLVDASGGNDSIAVAIAYVNAFLLLDLIALAWSLELVHRHRADLQALFALAGDLDAAIAVASFRAGVEVFCRPEIVPGGTALELEAAVHPLIPRAVPNGIRVEGRGVLVTGANMSGKSTLVRTVAINALLAQTIYTTLAARYRAPVLRVRALMSATDDVERSRSYYYAELEGAKALLEPSPEGTRTLVVLDELFRGTNTDERIGAGKAVLEALRRAGHFVFAFDARPRAGRAAR